jgi:hypothetical protein
LPGQHREQLILARRGAIINLKAGVKAVGLHLSYLAKCGFFTACILLQILTKVLYQCCGRAKFEELHAGTSLKRKTHFADQLQTTN